MKLFKRKPPKMIQARFIYDTSRIGAYQHYSDWQIVTEKQFENAVYTLDGWSSCQFIALGDLVVNHYNIRGFEKREIK